MKTPKTCNYVKKRLFAKFLRTRFLQNTSGRLLPVFFIRFTVFLPRNDLIETRFFLFLNMLKGLQLY